MKKLVVLIGLLAILLAGCAKEPEFPTMVTQTGVRFGMSQADVKKTRGYETEITEEKPGFLVYNDEDGQTPITRYEFFEDKLVYVSHSSKVGGTREVDAEVDRKMPVYSWNEKYGQAQTGETDISRDTLGDFMKTRVIDRGLPYWANKSYIMFVFTEEKPRVEGGKTMQYRTVEGFIARKSALK